MGQERGWGCPPSLVICFTLICLEIFIGSGFCCLFVLSVFVRLFVSVALLVVRDSLHLFGAISCKTTFPVIMQVLRTHA